jgi:hypothetical protein
MIVPKTTVSTWVLHKHKWIKNTVPRYFIQTNKNYIQTLNFTSVMLIVIFSWLFAIYLLCYWLLLRSGITQSVLCTATISWCTVRSIWVLMIPDVSTTELSSKYRRTTSSEAGRDLAINVLLLPVKSLCHTSLGSWVSRKFLRHGTRRQTADRKRRSMLVAIPILKLHIKYWKIMFWKEIAFVCSDFKIV